jgi:hypothetical protein
MDTKIQDPSQWQFKIEDVDPQRASEILQKCNRMNRRLRPGTVKKYSKIMKAGQWHLSPEPVIVSDTGRLLNGQHRLSAVVDADVSVPFLFVYGPDESTFEVLDRGATRTVADALGADKRASEAARLLCVIKAKSSVTDFEVKEALELMGDEHERLMEFCSTCSTTFSSAAFRLCAVARVIGGADREKTYQLYRSLVLGHTELLPPIGHAIMRMHLSGAIKANSGGGGIQYRLLQLAWTVFDPDKEFNTRVSSKLITTVMSEIIEAAYGEA